MQRAPFVRLAQINIVTVSTSILYDTDIILVDFLFVYTKYAATTKNLSRTKNSTVYEKRAYFFVQKCYLLQTIKSPVFLLSVLGRCNTAYFLENFCEIVIVAESNLFGNLRNGHILLQQQKLCRLNPAD